MTSQVIKSFHEISELIGGKPSIDSDLQIAGASGISEVSEGMLTFVEDLKRLPDAEQSNASAIIAPLTAVSESKPLILCRNPRVAFAKALRIFYPHLKPKPGIDPTARIGENVHLGQNVSIGAYVVLGDNAYIGDGTVLHPQVVVGESARIGQECEIYPQVTLYPGVILGDRVVLHAGVSLGSDGFGYLNLDHKFVKMPQIGSVQIGNDVEIGANSTVDCSTTGITQIGEGTKIDNLVHIAHNVVIGKDCAIAAQTGIAGSTKIGDRTILGGQVGARDHVQVGDDCIVAAKGGITCDLPSGSFVSGFPARPHHEELRFQASLRKVPELLRTIKNLEKRIQELEKNH